VELEQLALTFTDRRQEALRPLDDTVSKLPVSRSSNAHAAAPSYPTNYGPLLGHVLASGPRWPTLRLVPGAAGL
jgi:hypothetical protein